MNDNEKDFFETLVLGIVFVLSLLIVSHCAISVNTKCTEETKKVESK